MVREMGVIAMMHTDGKIKKEELEQNSGLP